MFECMILELFLSYTGLGAILFPPSKSENINSYTKFLDLDFQEALPSVFFAA